MRFVVLLHRWLGVAFCLLFITWFASGIVMMYARMPEVTARERLEHLPPLDLAAATWSPGDAAAKHHLSAQRVVMTMLLGRPVYRLLDRGRMVVVFADSGERFAGFSREDAIREVDRTYPTDVPAIPTYDAELTEPDQWTLQARRDLPMHRVSLHNASQTVIYLSDVTGQVAVRTTALERRVAYVGAVLHWLYFTPLRRNGPLWTQTIIWLSVAGSVMCALGLVWGLSVGWRSPYRGWMQWHHYAGLIFGVITFTWIFSGLLSMDPWNWHPDTSPTSGQRNVFSGGPLRLDRVSLSDLRNRVAGAPAKEIEVAQFRGEPRLIVDGQSAGVINRDVLAATAHEAMPGVAIEDITWLESYDAYYYSRADDDGARPLPVLRVRYADSVRTWLYIDPHRGAIVRKEERLSRLNRWLYHGLHSLDFPWLYWRRPMWDGVVILLSMGGIASALTSLVPAWRRLRRHAKRLYT